MFDICYSIVVRVVPGYPLIVIHNREEALDRKFTKLIEKDGIIGARDILSDGIWIGVNKRNGKILSMTNYRHKNCMRDGSKTVSRGILNDELIENKFNIQANVPLELKHNFDGFNVIMCDIYPEINAKFISNCNHTTIKPAMNGFNPHIGHVRHLDDGIYVVSNGMINDDKIWTRVRYLKKKLNEWIYLKKSNSLTILNELIDKVSNKDNHINEEHKQIFTELREIISDKSRFNDNELPSIFDCQFSPYNHSIEKEWHSSIFTKNTVSQSIVILNDTNNGTLTHFYQNDSRKGITNENNWEYISSLFP